MVKRWAASSLPETEKGFHKIMGYKDMWMSEAALKKTLTILKKVAQTTGKAPATFHYGWDKLI